MSAKVGFLGLGDYGSRIAARLINGGQDLVLIARGETLRRLHSEGLRPAPSATGKAEPAIDKVNVNDDAATVGHLDFLFMSVKLYQLDQACRDAAPLAGPNTTVIPLCNGVTAMDVCADHFGSDRVIGAATGAPLYIGEWPRGLSERTATVVSMFAGSTQPTEEHTDVIDVIWKKFVAFCGGGAVCAVSRQAVAGVAARPELRELSRQASTEAATVADALGVRGAYEGVEVMARRWDNTESNPGWKPSLLQDLEAGRPLELDASCGAVVKLGAEAGVPTPVNHSLYAALKPFENGV